MRPLPVASYRLQLSAAFGFDAAAAVLPLLSQLGISHVYLSPILQAAAGSAHGYDVIAHDRLDGGLGGPEAYARFCAVAQGMGLQQILDIVPNHMSIRDRRNAWWWDVLENGPGSRYASFFDVDWDSTERPHRDVLLLPILGDPRGQVLERRELSVVREGERFVVRYFDDRVPVSFDSSGALLRAALAHPGLTSAQRDALGFLGDAALELPENPKGELRAAPRRHRDQRVLSKALARLLTEEPQVASAVDAQLEALNADPQALDAFLERQHHRLTHWRTAEREVDYRRFFDINSLVGLRVEDDAVFDATHGLIGRLLAEGKVCGLRVDHVDGLSDPQGYLERLRALAPQASIWVEKILCGDEALPERFPVEGTTGYEFGSDVLALFQDPAAEAAFTRLHQVWTLELRPFWEVATQTREQVLREVLAADVERVTQLLALVCATHWRYRDHTRHALRLALRAFVVAFDVYRTYAVPGAPAASQDVRRIEAVVARATEAHPTLDATLFGLMGDCVLGRFPGPEANAFARSLQQLTGPSMAKGVEDTAFYLWSRCLALNEVGADPARFALGPQAFHQKNLQALERWPGRMVSTSTHDSKRSEDVRARLCALTLDPARWAATATRWRELNAPKRREGLPDPDLELHLYQTLLGAWPLSFERAWRYLEKAAREAKRVTSWATPNVAHEAALRGFLEACYADSDFIAQLARYAAELDPLGQRISLSQLVLKLTVPGMPDLYQGSELWNFQLVDPDNRGAVDWTRLERGLEALTGQPPSPESGLSKLWLVQRALAVRRRFPKAFSPEGGYHALDVTGPSEQAFGFVRGGAVAVCVPRLIAQPQQLEAHVQVRLPEGRWRSVLSGARYAGGAVEARALFRDFPVALLAREDGA